MGGVRPGWAVDEYDSEDQPEAVGAEDGETSIVLGSLKEASITE